ncbi:MAG: hypothetical protein AB4426_10740 [Xenococcaceae cyanobacterium]
MSTYLHDSTSSVFLKFSEPKLGRVIEQYSVVHSERVRRLLCDWERHQGTKRLYS